MSLESLSYSFQAVAPDTGSSIREYISALVSGTFSDSKETKLFESLLSLMNICPTCVSRALILFSYLYKNSTKSAKIQFRAGL